MAWVFTKFIISHRMINLFFHASKDNSFFGQPYFLATT